MEVVALINTEDSWFNPYYSFWGKKDGVIHFQKIKEHSVKNDFHKSIKRKKQKYTLDPSLDEHVKKEFEQLETIRRLKRNV